VRSHNHWTITKPHSASLDGIWCVLSLSRTVQTGTYASPQTGRRAGCLHELPLGPCGPLPQNTATPPGNMKKSVWHALTLLRMRVRCPCRVQSGPCVTRQGRQSTLQTQHQTATQADHEAQPAAGTCSSSSSSSNSGGTAYSCSRTGQPLSTIMQTFTVHDAGKHALLKLQA
jgi:hypothetical protein